MTALAEALKAAPLVHDRCFYDAARMEQARFDRYQYRIAEVIASGADPYISDSSVIRRLMYGAAVQDSVRHRPIPKHRAMVRLDDLPKAATRARAVSDSPR